MQRDRRRSFLPLQRVLKHGRRRRVESAWFHDLKATAVATYDLGLPLLE